MANGNSNPLGEYAILAIPMGAAAPIDVLFFPTLKHASGVLAQLRQEFHDSRVIVQEVRYD